MRPSILGVHPDRKTQRTVQRILGGSGHGVEAADDLEQAAPLIGQLEPILVWSTRVRGRGRASTSIDLRFTAGERVPASSYNVFVERGQARTWSGWPPGALFSAWRRAVGSRWSNTAMSS